jgi:hypothetical protein
MKTKLLSLILLIICFSMFGKAVDENRAKTVGLNFLQNKTNSSLLKKAANLQLAYKVTAKLGDALTEQTLFYVFNVDSIGFVIVSGDDTVIPILGYSDQGNFHSDNMPPAFQKWLEGYKNEIIYVVSHDIKATEEIDKLWSLKNNNPNARLSSNAVAPLVQTHWNQGSVDLTSWVSSPPYNSDYYNFYCPSDAASGKKAVTGCVATAMAQVMKFWNYPASGTNFHSYNHLKYGTLSANFGNTTYQWSSMPNQLISSSTSIQNNAIATLMYHCGVSVNMNYGIAATGGSGSQIVEITQNQPSAEYALKNYFGYNSNIKHVLRTDYPNNGWFNLLKIELDAGRPIIYGGVGINPNVAPPQNQNGHCFIADGYDSNNNLHFNWGWGGLCDGNYPIGQLNPSLSGAGGSSNESFNDINYALIGIQPPTSQQTYNLSLYDYVTPSATTINYGQAFTVSTNIANDGTNIFSGDYTVGAFDSNGNFIDYVETKTNYLPTLLAGYVYSNNIVFSTAGSFKMLPGTYKLGLFYRPTGGGWKIVANSGNYTNLPQITVVNPNSISLNSAMTVSGGTTLTQGQGASVNLNIINNGSTTFTGLYNVGLYTLDGTFVQTIGVLNESSGLQAGYTYGSPYLTFTTAAITASPGSYLVALEHQSTGGNWTLTGSTSSFINPIKVTVIQAPYQADIYENNDTFNQSYSLPLSFSGNTANVNTSGSNAHIGTDNDYYKIVLPTGYNYTITPRLQDSYSSNNGNTYTLDALFTYSTDGVNWSSVYDDVLPSNITVNNGGTIYFHVAPYFQGNIGTYLLDVNLSRIAALSTNQNEFLDTIKLYPNPTSSKVFFDNTNSNFNEVAIYNYLGQEVSKSSFNTVVNNQEIDMNTLASGVYLLKLNNTEKSITVKIIKE